MLGIHVAREPHTGVAHDRGLTWFLCMYHSLQGWWFLGGQALILFAILVLQEIRVKEGKVGVGKRKKKTPAHRGNHT